jgi:hypothetical protein
VNTTRRMNTTAVYQLLEKVRPSWWKGGIREITLVLVIYAAYSLTQGGLTDREFLAFHNAYNVIGFETQLKIFWELGIQSWFLRSDSLVQLTNALYTFLFYPVLISFSIWAYKYHRQQYSIARNALFISAAIGLPCFALYPMAPPRLLPDLGFVDTLAKYQMVNYNSSLSAILVNQYAAMPSFHFAWTLLVGIATICIAKAWWLKLAGILLPLLTLVSIIATANHFILDAIAGAVVTGLSYGLVMLFAKLIKHRTNSIKKLQIS